MQWSNARTRTAAANLNAAMSNRRESVHFVFWKIKLHIVFIISVSLYYLTSNFPEVIITHYSHQLTNAM